jgi:hypothetical protein
MSRFAEEPDAPRRRALEAEYQADERRLPSSVRPGDRDELPLADTE